jgi:uncharacterized iron-regulated protein
MRWPKRDLIVRNAEASSGSWAEAGAALQFAADSTVSAKVKSILCMLSILCYIGEIAGGRLNDTGLLGQDDGQIR